MLSVLLESRAPRARRVKGTVASALLHAALVAGAVAVTMPVPVDANGVASPPPKVDWVLPSPVPRPPVAQPGVARIIAPRSPVIPTIAVPDVVPTSLSPIDVGPAIPPDQVVIGGAGSLTASPAGPWERSSIGNAAVDERFVDRAPRLVGRALEPRYPASLRDAGVEGRVVVQFVVDTLGRAEPGELQVLDAPHALFVESVRAALARYRFTVGETAGRKVRTRVQMPFEFTLVR